MANLCQKEPRIYSVCRNYNPILSSFMTYQRVCSNSNVMLGVTSGAETGDH
jgi:hypothetical protein